MTFGLLLSLLYESEPGGAGIFHEAFFVRHLFVAAGGGGGDGGDVVVIVVVLLCSVIEKV